MKKRLILVLTLAFVLCCVLALSVGAADTCDHNDVKVKVTLTKTAILVS